ncbi:MAG TPA: lipopolysaccharide biosynthesis protein [Terriglobia bacterium]|nr:lipopolysaccharide biosynthesis protein [Terriglobia bacterium]
MKKKEEDYNPSDTPPPGESSGDLTPSAKGFYKPLLAGLAWTAAGKWSTQVLTWTTTLVVARLLSPSDFGLVGMATVYLGLITLLSEFGLGSAIIYLRELTQAQVEQLNSLSVGFGVGAFGISCLVAFPLAWFFKSRELTWVLLVMSTDFIITAFQTIPYALFQRDKSFKLLAMVDGTRALTQSLSTLALSVLGLRYWSLVIGGILGSCTSVGMLVTMRQCRFGWPKLGSLRRAIKFSRDIIVSRLSWYAYSNSDFVVAGRMLGQGPLGAYTLAWNLASTSTEKVTDLISRVMPAFVSEAQKDVALLRRYVRNLTEGISLITFPITLGSALVSRDFILFALGEKWEGAIVPLQLLALYSCIRSITTLFAPILNAVDVRWASRYSLLFVVVFPPAFYVGSRWGTAGIAAGWVCFYPLIYLPIYRHLFRCIQMPLADYMTALWPALSASIVMVIVVSLLKLALPPEWARIVRLGLEILGGACAYLLMLGIAHADRFRAVIQVLKSAGR